jgi:ATP-dependent Lon protease
MSGQTPLPRTPVELPLLPLRDVVVFPHMVIPLFVGRPKSIKALESAMESERRIMLVAQKAAAKDEPSTDDMFEMGCVATILQMLKLPDGISEVALVRQIELIRSKRFKHRISTKIINAPSGDTATQVIKRWTGHDLTSSKTRALIFVKPVGKIQTRQGITVVISYGMRVVD